MCESIMNMNEDKREVGECAPNFKGQHIPLIRSSCLNVCSPLYGFTNKCQFVVNQRAQLALERQKVKRKKKSTKKYDLEEKPLFQLLPDYHSTEFIDSLSAERLPPIALNLKIDPVLEKYNKFEASKRELMQQFDKKLEYKTSSNYKRISPELENLFEPNITLKNKHYPKQELLTFHFKDPREEQGGPLLIDEKSSGLAKYLRQVIENNAATNALYGIKFDVQKLKLGRHYRNPYDVLNPSVIEALLNKLISKRPLSPQELELFADFLNVASQLHVKDLDSYFKLLFLRGGTLFEALDKLRKAFMQLDSFDFTTDNVKNFLTNLRDVILHGDPADKRKQKRLLRMQNAMRLSDALTEAEDWTYAMLHGKSPKAYGMGKDPRLAIDFEGSSLIIGAQDNEDQELKPGQRATKKADRSSADKDHSQKQKHHYHPDHPHSHGEHPHHHADHAHHHHHKQHQHGKDSLTESGKKHGRSQDMDTHGLTEYPFLKSDKKATEKKEKSERLAEKKLSDKSVSAKKESTTEQETIVKRKSASLSPAEQMAKEAKKADTLKLEIIRKMERIADERRRETERKEKEDFKTMGGHFTAPDHLYDDRSKELVEKPSLTFMKPNVEREFRLKLASAMSAAQKYADKSLFIQDSYSLEDFDGGKRGISVDYYGDHPLKDVLQKSVRSIYNDTLRLMERFSYTNSGAHMPGYYEPWDVEFPWTDTQELFEQINKAFTKLSPNPHFIFRRGMEYYQNLFKREEEQKLAKEKSIDVTVTQKKKGKKVK